MYRQLYNHDDLYPLPITNKHVAVTYRSNQVSIHACQLNWHSITSEQLSELNCIQSDKLQLQVDIPAYHSGSHL